MHPSPPLHPYVKALAIIETLVLILLRPGLIGYLHVYALWLMILVLLWLIAGMNLKSARIPILSGLAMSIILVGTQGFLFRYTTTTTPLFKLFDIQVAGKDIGSFTLEGLVVGLGGSLKILCILVSSQVFVVTTTMDDFSYVLIRLGIPNPFVFALTTAMRFVSLAQETWGNVLDAHRLRGLDIDGLGLIRRLILFYPRVVIPLILYLFKIGVQLDIAITTRGFGLRGKKTTFHEPHMSAKDYLISVGLVLSFAFEAALLFGM